MSDIESDNVHLVLTSPPYPIVTMWDELFSNMSSEIKKALEEGKDKIFFDLIHNELDKIWKEVYRVLSPGGFCCINIGDAVRTFNKKFQLYSNHTRILQSFIKLNFDVLPTIIWKKPTNSPTKFMGSGMLPSGAYVTLEHEYILIFRKNGKRLFKTEMEKIKRRESAFFWEERNIWFSDMWDIKGVSQKIESAKSRERSAAFPFEFAYRLINMFSLKKDLILDPFLGTGTTTSSAMVAGRNSIGYEIDENLKDTINSNFTNIADFGNKIIDRRIEKHLKFVKEREDNNYIFKYNNNSYNFPIMTKQEENMYINKLENIKVDNSDNSYTVSYFSELNTKKK